MGLLGRLLGLEKRAERLPAGGDFLPRWWSLFGGGVNETGITVTPDVALTASAVWSAVSCVSDAIAGLPLHIADKSEGRRRDDHDLYALLHDTPNEYMTSASFRTALMVNLLLFGNGYAFIAKDELGRPVGLYPMLSRCTRPVRKDGELYFVTQVGDAPFTIPQEHVFHVLGLTLDGVNGLSPIEHQRQTIGLSLAMERFAAAFFGKGANLGGLIETPGMHPDAAKDFLDKWRAAYTSPDNWFKIGMLPPGMKFHTTAATPEHAQAIESRVHQIREIARIFRVPPHKLMDLERATFSNIEHQAIEYMQETIRPWAVRIEAEANRKLLLESEKPILEVRFNLDALLRADTKSRYEAHNIAIQAGFLTRNEARAREGLPPIEGGDVLLQPLNMGPAGGASAPVPAPTPTPDKSAARALIEDAARRVLTKEGKALTRAAKKHAGKPSDLKAWAETFYRSHAGLVARTLAAPLKAASLDTNPEQYAADHCAASVRAITVAIDAGADAQDLADEFTDIRPTEIAQQLLAA